MVNPLAAYGLMLSTANPWDKSGQNATAAFLEQSDRRQGSDAVAKMLSGDIGAISPDVVASLPPEIQAAIIQSKFKAKAEEQDAERKRQLLAQMGIMGGEGGIGALGGDAESLSAASILYPELAPYAKFKAEQERASILSPYQAESIDLRRQEVEDRRAAREATEESRRIAAEEKRAAKINQDTQELSTALDKQGIPELGQALATVEDALALYEGKDIPGFGKVAGQLPDALISSEGSDLRQQVSRVGNAILKARSGGAVTPQEAARLLRELGVNETPQGLVTLEARDDRQVVEGMKMVGQTLAERIKNVQGGFAPEVIDTYKKRGGSGFDYMSRREGGKKPDSSTAAGGLTPEEQAELDALRKKYGR